MVTRGEGWREGIVREVWRSVCITMTQLAVYIKMKSVSIFSFNMLYFVNSSQIGYALYKSIYCIYSMNQKIQTHIFCVSYIGRWILYH